MRCDRCGADVTTVYYVADEEVCRWCLDPDEWNQIATRVAQEEAER